MTENPAEISATLTRIVLTEKAPFWIEVVYDNGDFDTFLVRVCVSNEDLVIKGKHIGNRNFCDYYIITTGAYEDLLIHKEDCKRVKI